MKTRGWIVIALVVGVVFGLRPYAGCMNQPEPDQRLAAHFAELCVIARDHVAKPEKGVRVLGRYLGTNTGPILGSLGSTIALIERIPDDGAHDARARLARDRIQKPLRTCERDWQRFAEAVEANPEASALVDHAAKRLNRTLEIIFGGRAGARPFTLRELPARLRRLL